MCANANEPQDFEQIRNPHHWDGISSCSVGESKTRDISGMYVLIAMQFAYFGRSTLPIPVNLRPTVPFGVSRYGSESRNQFETQAFIDYVFEQAEGRQVIAPPHDWPKDDDSWKREK